MSLRNEIASSGKTVVVLCGGDSSEREVSLVSGKSAADALTSSGVDCELVDLEKNTLPGRLDPEQHLILPLIHGKYGEDGTLSSDLEQNGFAYAGCGQAASVLCYDKFASKAIAEKLGIPVAADRLIRSSDNHEFDALAAELGLPFIMKPRWDGSSVGLYLINNSMDFSLANEANEEADYLAESYLEGMDVTVGILGSKALGVVAIRPKGGLYDYEHKYSSGMSLYEAPADIDPTVGSRLAAWSEAVFGAMDCRDMARVDFRLSSNGEANFLEINTVPGMTPTSLLPKSAGCCGISFPQLLLELVGFALRRSREVVA